MHIRLAGVLPLVAYCSNTALAVTSNDPGNGIACQGASKYCSGDYPRIELLKNFLAALADTYSIDDTYQIKPDTYFAQNGAFFTAFRNIPGGRSMSLGTAKRVLDQLYQHGCRGCGRAPIGPVNDLSQGFLEVNVDFNGILGVDYSKAGSPPANLTG